MKRLRTILSWAPLTLTIPSKYLRPKRGNLLFFALSFATIFSAFVCTVVALIALAATNGADKELREKLAGIDSHVLVFPANQYQTHISNYQDLTQKLYEISNVTAVAPFLISDVQLQSSGDDPEPYPVRLKGILAEREITTTNLANYIIEGNLLLFLGKYRTEILLIVGSGLAANMGIHLGDTLLIVKPELFNDEIRKFPAKVAGIFRTGLGLDYHLAYAPLDQVQSIVAVNDSTITGFGIKGDDLLKADLLAAEVKKILGEHYRVEDWKSINPNVFAGISLLQRVSLILLNGVYLLVLVCLSCILLLVLHEKRPDIAVLLTLGMKPFRVQIAFAFLGMLIGISGILIAFIITPLLCKLFNNYRVFELPPEVLMIDYVPFILEWRHFFWVGLAELFLLVLVGFVTTSNIYKLKPVVILRDE